MCDTLTGQIKGRWTIGEEFKKGGRIYHKCVCKCGSIKDVSRQALLNGTSLSCGCYAKEIISKNCSKDLTGQKFTNLTVLERLANYKNNKTFYNCVCDCGNTRIVYGYDLSSGKVTMCKECREKEFSNGKRKDYTGQEFGKLIIIKMIYGKYQKTKALCRCECGNEKVISIQNILNGHMQSCGCYETESRHYRDHLVDILGKKYGMLLALRPTNKRASNGNVVWECKCNCGNVTYVNYSNLTTGHTLSCGCKKNSKREDFIASYLKSINVLFEREKRFEDCRNIQQTDMLPFDFYIPDRNIILEYDGLQHFESIDYWGGQEKFVTIQRNDKIKNDYCKRNNIILLRLPYTLSECEIIEKIQNILNP